MEGSNEEYEGEAISNSLSEYQDCGEEYQPGKGNCKKRALMKNKNEEG